MTYNYPRTTEGTPKTVPTFNGTDATQEEGFGFAVPR